MVVDGRRISTQPYAADGTNLGDPGKLKEEIDLEQEIDWLSTTDRLWVWDPEDVDRLVAVYGDAPENGAPSSPLTRAWMAVTDLDGTPVALLDHASGAVAARQGFDAQGNLVESSRHAVGGYYAPQLEVGWKGLFAARLDNPLTDEVVVTEDGVSGAATGDGAVVIYDVRARVYRPSLGRFMQQDPLGTGVVVRESLRWAGEAALVAAAGGFDEARAYQDGQHRMAFARANGVGKGDPTGLFGSRPRMGMTLPENMACILPAIGPTTVVDLWSTHMENTLEWGGSAANYAAELFGDYALNQELDFEWALDWSMDDHDYSGSATASEFYNPMPALIDDGHGPALASILGVARSAARMASRAGSNVSRDLHHLIPKFLGGDKNGTMFGLPKSTHKLFHRMLDQRMQEHFGHAANWGAKKWGPFIASLTPQQKLNCAVFYWTRREILSEYR